MVLSPRKRIRASITALMLTLDWGCLCEPIHGAEGVWQTEQGGDWHLGDNWLGGIPDGVGDRALFPNSHPNSDATIQIDEPLTLGQLEFNNPFLIQIEGIQSLTFDDTAAALPAALIHRSQGVLEMDIPIEVPQGDLFISVDDALGKVSLNSKLSVDGGSLRKDGLGTLALTASNSGLSGQIVVELGRLFVTNNGALGGGSGADASATVANAGGSLVIDTGITISDEKLQLNGGALLGAGTVFATMEGPIELLSNSVIGTIGEGFLRVDGPVSGPGGLTIREGFAFLRSANSYDGPTVIEGGELRLTNASALGSVTTGTRVTGGILRVGGARNEPITLEGGELDLNTSGGTYTGDIEFTAGRLTAEVGSGTLAGQLILRPNFSGVVDPAAGRTLVLQGGTTGEGNLRLTGPGSLRVENTALSHAGTVTVENGRLITSTQDVLDTPLMVEGGLVLVNAPQSPPEIDITGGVVQINNSGSLVGAGPITLYESGELRLGGPVGTIPAIHHLSPGQVILAGGVLAVTSDVEIQDVLSPASQGGVIALSLSARFTNGQTNLLDLNDMAAGDRINLSATASGRINSTLTLLPHRDTHTIRFGGGSGTLTVDAILMDVDDQPTHAMQTLGGHTVLNAVNTYTGQTIIESGVLEVALPAALGSGSGGVSDATIIKEGGTLELRNNVFLESERLILRGGRLSMANAGSAAQVNGPITLASTSEIVGTSQSSSDGLRLGGEIEGDGELHFPDGQVWLEGANTYSGRTLLDGGFIRVTNSDGLGATTGGTVIQSGQLTLAAVVNEPIRVETDGRVVVEADALPHGGVVTLAGGEVELPNGSTFASRVTLDGETSTLSGTNLTFSGGSNGQGDLSLSGGVIDGAPFAHDGALILKSSAAVRTENTFTGEARLEAGTFVLEHPAGLGSAGAPIVVADDGRLELFADPEREVLVRHGTLVNQVNQPLTANITLGGTQLFNDGPAILEGEGTYSGDIVLRGEPFSRNGIRQGMFTGRILGPGSVSLGDVTLAGTTELEGIMEIGGTVHANTPRALVPERTILRTGTLHLNEPIDGPITLDRGVLWFNHAQEFEFLWANNRAQLHASASVVIRELIQIDRETLGGVGESPIEFDQSIVSLRGIRIDPAGIKGNADLRLLGGESDFYGMPQYDGDIYVGEGRATVWNDDSLGTTNGDTHVLSDLGGYVVLRGQIAVAEDFFLHNAHGFDGRGALREDGSRTATLTGRVDVGDVGSTLGGSIRLNGRLTGHNLYLVEAGLELTSAQNELTGSIFMNNGSLRLSNQGTITGIDRIELHNGGISLGNDDPSGLNLSDRVSDDILVVSYGGGISLWTPHDGAATETFGTLRARAGRTNLFISDEDTASSNLTINTLDRERGATVAFDVREGDVVIQDDRFTPGALLGGWATTTDGFAALDGNRRVVTLAPTTDNLAGAGPDDHVEITAASGGTMTLSADTSVQSIAINNAGRAATINLNSHQLDIASGGIAKIVSGELDITDGEITSSGGELILTRNEFSGFRVNVSADIIDAPGTPVAFTFNGNRLRLSGNNTYTGGSSFSGPDGGEVQILNAAAVPEGERLSIHGLTYRLELDAQSTIPYESIRLSADGRIESQGASIAPGVLILESGRVDVPVVGDGLIIKETRGAAVLQKASRDFHGTVEVREGRLGAGEGTLGDASIRVLEGGTLTLSTTLRNDVTLEGGMISNFRPAPEHDPDAGESDGLRGQLHVLSPSILEARNLNTSSFGRLQIFSTVLGDDPLIIRGERDLSPTRTFVALRGDMTDYTGDITVESGTLRITSRDGTGQGEINVMEGGQLQIGRFRTTEPVVNLLNTINLHGGELVGSTQGDVIIHDRGFLGLQPGRGGAIELGGTTILNDGAQVIGIGDDVDVQISGELRIDGEVSWHPMLTQVVVSGRVRAGSQDASLDFQTLMNDPFESSQVMIEQGRSLRLHTNGKPLMLDLAAGGVLSGSGTLQSDVTLGDGAELAPGMSVGELVVDGDMRWNGGGVYRWELQKAEGDPGQGYDAVRLSGDLTISASDNDPFVIELIGLDENGLPGAVMDFDPTDTYSWIIAYFDELVGWDETMIDVDAAALVDQHGLLPDGQVFQLRPSATALHLKLVPEPTSALLLVVITGGICSRRPRRAHLV